MLSPDLNEVRVQHDPTVGNVSPGPERSEGPLIEDRARTRSIELPVVTYCPDLNVVRVQHLSQAQNVSREPVTQ